MAVRASRRLRQVAIRYGNIKSRLGEAQADALSRRIEREHETALRAVNSRDIQRSGLPDGPRRDLLAA